MNNLLEYKGYYGTVEFSDTDNILYGKVIGINSLISYEGDSVQSLKQDFQGAVDNYLEMCANALEVVETGKQWWKGWGELLEGYVPKIVQAGAILIGEPYEKYGSLRLSVEYPISDEVLALLNELEDKSEKVCERCGKEATIKEKGGWYKAICEDCFKEWKR